MLGAKKRCPPGGKHEFKETDFPEKKERFLEDDGNNAQCYQERKHSAKTKKQLNDFFLGVEFMLLHSGQQIWRLFFFHGIQLLQRCPCLSSVISKNRAGNFRLKTISYQFIKWGGKRDIANLAYQFLGVGGVEIKSDELRYCRRFNRLKACIDKNGAAQWAI